jgi:hypothetical protein
MSGERLRMTSGRSRIGWLSAGICVVIATLCALNTGILVESRIEWLADRDFQARRMVITPIMKCRYLRALGVVERQPAGDGERQTCRFLIWS